MMYTAVVCLIFTVFLYFLGADHTSAFYKSQDAEKKKAQMMVGSGVFSIFAATLAQCGN